jgi:DNA primase
VATDNDQAGHTAAHRAFWQLAARGEDPRQLLLPPGTDPAELFQTHGPQALRAALDDAPPLADRIIADRTAPYTDQLDTIEGRIHALRQAADIIGALPPSRWHDRAQTTAQQLGVAPSTALNEVLDAGHAWTEDPHGRARQRLTQRIPAPAPIAAPLDPTRHWASLADTLTASTGIDLRADPHWPVLAEHLTHAAATGYDVHHRLIVLTSHRPLPDQHPARDLDFRLISDWPECLPPTDPATSRANHPDEQPDDATRQAVDGRHTARRPAPDQALPAATHTPHHPAGRPTSTPPVTSAPRPPRGPAR